MKRSEFIKRLGLGIGAAVAAPSLLKGEEKPIKTDKGIAMWRNSPDQSISSAPTFSEYRSPRFIVTDIDGDAVDLNNVSMQIKNKTNDIYLKDGRGLSVHGNYVDMIAGLPRGESDCELIIDNVLAFKGKIYV